MLAPDVTTLDWRAPRSLPTETFARLKPRLEAALQGVKDDGVYAVNARTIYRVDDSELGAIGIKELRFERRLQQWRAAWLRRHRILCEFHAADVFTCNGGLTPRLYGAALEWHGFGLGRVFILMQWLDDAVTLPYALQQWHPAEFDARIAALADALVAAANTGLVHGRHSPENLLVDRDQRLLTIDFSHAQIHRGFRPAGFAHDIARIGARLHSDGTASPSFIDAFFDGVSRRAPGDRVTREVLMREYRTILGDGKQRQKLRRRARTLWRGWPFRLVERNSISP